MRIRSWNNKLLWICAAALLTVSAPAAATEGGEPDAKAIIFEHLQDSYWWHITTIGKHHVTVYLPVIVYSPHSGLHVFSSSRIAHGEACEGFRIAGEGRHKGKVVERNAAGEEVRPIDISLTKTAFALIFNSLLVLVIFLSVAAWYRRHPGHAAPGRLIGTIEMLVMNIEEDIIRKSIGKDYARYSPYLLTAFFFILVNNVMGLVPVFPGGANTTGNIAVTLTLAICTTLAVNLFGNREYWREILWPRVPMWMKAPAPLMPLIEIAGVISKPFALMIRLFANITAGHAIVLSLMTLIFVTVKMGAAMNIGMTAFAILLSVFMNLLELLVAYIQAYVFTILSAVFIGLSRPEAHAGNRKEHIRSK
ncbi:MAG: F0F1 ATP synthase subunit A [Tannerella sp.]|jgi:F-type H+-transporting ATPase subunit a|nr:F0F1 ATP synthase subunit A [Tannerella sp.]